MNWKEKWYLIMGAIIACIIIGAMIASESKTWVLECAKHRPLAECKADRAQLDGEKP